MRSEARPTQQKLNHLSYLRAVACLAIVVLHTFLTASRLFGPSGAALTGSMIARNTMLWAVPCFVMVTGALLLDPERRITTGKIFGVYVRRMVVVLAAATLVFSVFDAVVDRQAGGVLGLVLRYVRALFTNGSWLHLWYLYMLIGLYIMLPLYRLLVKHLTRRDWGYLLTVYFVFLSVVPTIGYLCGVQIGFYITVYTIYPLYLFLGYALRKGVLRLSLPTAAGITAVSTAVIVLATWAGMHFQNQNLQTMCSSYASVFVVLQAAGLFSLFQRLEHLSAAPLKQVLLAVDRCSFGIYLVHVLVLYVLYRVLRFNPYLHGGLGMLCVLVAVVFAASYGISFALKQVPGVRRYL